MMSVFSERLKSLREDRKKQNSTWTQGYVAKIIGVARSSYTAYENGTKQPSLECVQKLADLFDVSTDYLLGRTEYPHTYKDREEFKEMTMREGFKQYGEFITDEQAAQILEIIATKLKNNRRESP